MVGLPYITDGTCVEGKSSPNENEKFFEDILKILCTPTENMISRAQSLTEGYPNFVSFGHLLPIFLKANFFEKTVYSFPSRFFNKSAWVLSDISCIRKRQKLAWWFFPKVFELKKIWQNFRWSIFESKAVKPKLREDEDKAREPGGTKFQCRTIFRTPKKFDWIWKNVFWVEGPSSPPF